MPKNIVVCLDGTNNQIKAADNTNVLRTYAMLDLSDPDRQVAYYQPGVGTFSSPAAWTPTARSLSRLEGLVFGAGMRQNLADAYRYLMAVYEPGDVIYVFGFSRGAYTARALTGMLDVFGIFRRGTENLIPYAVSVFTRRDKNDHDYWDLPRAFAQVLGQPVDHHTGHLSVHFLGLWDTVKAAGTIAHQLRWPYTLHLSHVHTIRHAIAIDEDRRPYAPYPVIPLNPGDPVQQRHHFVDWDQDLLQVLFAGVHSDVGGMFPDDPAPAEPRRLSDIPLKWIAQHAVTAGLLVKEVAFAEVETQVTAYDAIAPVHAMSAVWRLAGTRRRLLPNGAMAHASVRRRIAQDASYAVRMPADVAFVDEDWLTSRTPLAVDR